MKKIILSLMLLSVQALSAATIYVNASATGSNNGTSWANAYTSLQSALSAAKSGDQIWVAKGTYKPSATDRSVSFYMISNVSIYGGFTGSETAVYQRVNFLHVQINETFLSGDIGTIGDNSDNSYSVFNQTGVINGILDGFTITGGNGGLADNNGNGGGMCNNGYGSGSSLTITNVTFLSNNSSSEGGGLYSLNSTLTLTNVNFISNSSVYNGGGMVNTGDTSVTLENVTFSSNSITDSNGHGGGMDFTIPVGGYYQTFSCYGQGDFLLGFGILGGRFEHRVCRYRCAYKCSIFIKSCGAGRWRVINLE